jgi:hypothetical protein
VSGALLAGGRLLPAPPTLDVRGLDADGAGAFTPRGARKVARGIVVHESVTTSVAATERALELQGLGAHLIVGPEGEVTQYGDLARDVLWHAGPALNGHTIGVEVVNPYEPRLFAKGLPWQRVIRAPWAFGGRYVLPTQAQAEALAEIVRWLTDAARTAACDGLRVPRLWPGIDGRRAAFTRVAGVGIGSEGVLAHQYAAHADGAFLVLYAWLRIEAGLAPEGAFEAALHAATGANAYAVLPKHAAG